MELLANLHLLMLVNLNCPHSLIRLLQEVETETQAHSAYIIEMDLQALEPQKIRKITHCQILLTKEVVMRTRSKINASLLKIQLTAFCMLRQKHALRVEMLLQQQRQLRPLWLSQWGPCQVQEPQTCILKYIQCHHAVPLVPASLASQMWGWATEVTSQPTSQR